MRFPLAMCAASLAALLFLQTPQLRAAEGPEDFRIELTGSAWLVDSSGTIQASGAPINLISDLGAEQQQPTFYGRFIFKPRHRQRIIVEGTPISVSGNNVVNRAVVYRGQTFNLSETVQSSANFNYLFIGYQYDILNTKLGHLGLNVGGAYANASGTLTDVTSGIVASRTETLGLPLAGVEFRVFPIPSRKLIKHKLLEVEGGVRGMDVGSYGHYVEGSLSGGVRFRSFGILAGYREIFADIHSTSASPSGVNVRFKGPVFSLLWAH